MFLSAPTLPTGKHTHKNFLMRSRLKQCAGNCHGSHDVHLTRWLYGARSSENKYFLRLDKIIVNVKYHRHRTAYARLTPADSIIQPNGWLLDLANHFFRHNQTIKWPLQRFILCSRLHDANFRLPLLLFPSIVSNSIQRSCKIRKRRINQSESATTDARV